MSRLQKLSKEQKSNEFEIKEKLNSQIQTEIWGQLDVLLKGKLNEKFQKRLKELNLEDDYLKEIKESEAEHLNRLIYLPDSAKYASEVTFVKNNAKIKDKYISKINELSSENDKFLNMEFGCASQNKYVIRVKSEEFVSSALVYENLANLFLNENETSNFNENELRDLIMSTLKEKLKINTAVENSVGKIAECPQESKDFFDYFLDFSSAKSGKIAALAGAVTATVSLVVAEKQSDVANYIGNAGMGAIVGIGVCYAMALLIPSSAYLYSKCKTNKKNKDINKDLDSKGLIEEKLAQNYIFNMERAKGTNAFELEFANKNKVQQNAKEQELEQGK